MFARINHELAEREALEQQRQSLLKKKQGLIADNKKRKEDLASLDRELEGFIDVSVLCLVLRGALGEGGRGRDGNMANVVRVLGGYRRRSRFRRSSKSSIEGMAQPGRINEGVPKAMRILALEEVALEIPRVENIPLRRWRKKIQAQRCSAYTYLII